jgi:hypothetical protein
MPADSLTIGFALFENRLVAAASLTRGDTGPFFCPACRGRVFAHLGDIYRWHFKHQRKAACASSTGLTAAETALHLMAKQILCEALYIRTPASMLRAETRAGTLEVCVAPEGKVEWTEQGRAEAQLGTLRPDFLAHTTEGPFIVEVRVTHRVDSEKRGALSALGIPAIELDLSREERLQSIEALRHTVLDALHNKHWLAPPRQAAAQAELGALLFEQACRQRQAEAAHTDEFEDQELFSLWSQEDIEYRHAQLAEDETASEREERYAAQRAQAAKAAPVYRAATVEQKVVFLEAKLQRYRQDWPPEFLVGAELGFEYGVPPYVWRADVFRHFALGGVALMERPDIEIDAVVAWLTPRYDTALTDPRYIAEAVRAFCEMLAGAGYLAARDTGFAVMRDVLPLNVMPAENFSWRREYPSAMLVQWAAIRSGVAMPLWVQTRIAYIFCQRAPSLSVLDFARSLAASLAQPLERVLDFLLALDVAKSSGPGRARVSVTPLHRANAGQPATTPRTG